MSPKEQIEKLRKELSQHNYNYYVLDKPQISDYEFDMLLEKLQALEENYPEYFDANSPTQRVGGAVTKDFKTVKHKNRMYSLSNSYSRQDLMDWEKRIKKTVEDGVEFVCELKYDGASINLTYINGEFESAVTRGDGVQGDDVTANVRTIRSVPLRLKGDYPKQFEIRGEIVLPIQGFHEMNKRRMEQGEEPYRNPRNTASGSLKLQDSAIVAERPLECLVYHVVANNNYKTHYEYLQQAKEWGFKIPDAAKLAKNMDEVFKFIDYWNTERHDLPYETDGVVIKVNDIRQQESLGYTAKAPRWAMAYKFKSEQVSTILEKITYQVGRTGAITPVANLRPIELGGTIVKRASLHNADQIEKLDVREGDEVYVEKGGEIIPKIIAVDFDKRPKDTEPTSYISRCPECNTELVRKDGEAQHYCPNYNGCPPQIIGRIEHFISRKAMDIEGLGVETVALLVEAGLINNYADLYKLTKEDVLPLERIADKSAENMIKGIAESKSVPFERVLFALGIRYVGETVAKKLARHFQSINALASASFDELTAVNEIGERIAESVLEFFASEENRKIVKQLEDFGLNLEISQAEARAKSDKLDGKAFVVSGVFESFSRDELKKAIEDNGGKVVSSISSKTSYVIAGENMGPSKKEKAEKLSIPIITESDFINMTK